MYSSWSKAVQVLSRSAEDTQLVPDAAGGVREVPLQGSRRTDGCLDRAARYRGPPVKQALGGADQTSNGPWSATNSSSCSRAPTWTARPANEYGPGRPDAVPGHMGSAMR